MRAKTQMTVADWERVADCPHRRGEWWAVPVGPQPDDPASYSGFAALWCETCGMVRVSTADAVGGRVVGMDWSRGAAVAAVDAHVRQGV